MHRSNAIDASRAKKKLARPFPPCLSLLSLSTSKLTPLAAGVPAASPSDSESSSEEESSEEESCDGTRGERKA